MAKYTINLPDKVEKDLRERFENDKMLWKKCPEYKSTDNFEEYIVWFIEDYIAEIEDSED